MTGGAIISESEYGTAYGIYNAKTTITGGSVTGDTYGIYGAVATIGANDGIINIDTPTIVGGSYALYNGSINYYDGIIKGGNKAYYNRNIKAIADSSSMYIGTETIDGILYDVRYLTVEHDVAKIGNTNYTSLANAITAANTGDTIELLEDNYLFYLLSIPSGKDVTIDLSGFTIVTGNPITVNGYLKLTNSNTSTSPKIYYYENGTFINVKKNSRLELSNVEIETTQHSISTEKDTTLIIDGATLTSNNNYCISSEGNIEIKGHSVLNATSTAIYTSGPQLTVQDSTIIATGSSGNGIYTTKTSSTITVDNSSITAYNAFSESGENAQKTTNITNSFLTGGINTNDGSVTIDHSTINGVRSSGNGNYTIYNNGTMAVTNGSTIIRTDSAPWSYTSDVLTSVTNNGTLSISDSSVLFSNEMTGGSSSTNSNPLRAIVNSGTLTLNNAAVSITTAMAVTYYRDYSTTLYNTGTATINNSTFTVDHSYGRAIQAVSGTIDMQSSSIAVTGTTVYGIYIVNGEVTIGTPEPTDSQYYGTNHAAVSTTSPSISAIGTTSGIGVKKETGKFNYYDGIITGSTEAKPELPTKIEYLYEARNYTDANGYQYCILEFMR
jgi:hypothetical protein